MGVPDDGELSGISERPTVTSIECTAADHVPTTDGPTDGSAPRAKMHCLKCGAHYEITVRRTANKVSHVRLIIHRESNQPLVAMILAREPEIMLKSTCADESRIGYNVLQPEVVNWPQVARNARTLLAVPTAVTAAVWLLYLAAVGQLVLLAMIWASGMAIKDDGTSTGTVSFVVALLVITAAVPVSLSVLFIVLARKLAAGRAWSRVTTFAVAAPYLLVCIPYSGWVVATSTGHDLIATVAVVAPLAVLCVVILLLLPSARAYVRR
jgi:hypothetical protein